VISNEVRAVGSYQVRITWCTSGKDGEIRPFEAQNRTQQSGRKNWDLQLCKLDYHSAHRGTPAIYQDLTRLSLIGVHRAVFRDNRIIDAKFVELEARIKSIIGRLGIVVQELLLDLEFLGSKVSERETHKTPPGRDCSDAQRGRLLKSHPRRDLELQICLDDNILSESSVLELPRIHVSRSSTDTIARLKVPLHIGSNLDDRARIICSSQRTWSRQLEINHEHIGGVERYSHYFDQEIPRTELR
jgi:hypothetical protein